MSLQQGEEGGDGVIQGKHFDLARRTQSASAMMSSFNGHSSQQIEKQVTSNY